MLERSHGLLKSFIEYTPAAVAMFDKNLLYLAVSRRWLQDYQLGDRNIIGLHHYDVFPEIRHMQEWQEIHQRCLAGAIERREADPFTRADGCVDWIRWEVRPWHDEFGQIGGLVMFTEVITERKRTEQAVRLFRAVLDQADDSIEIIDPVTGRFIDCNEKSFSSLGYTRQELLSLTVPDIDPIVTAPIFAQNVKQIRENGTVTLETLHRRKDGSTFPVEVKAHLIQFDREYLLAIVRDISERKQAEEALRLSEQRYVSLLNSVSGIVWEADPATF